MSGQPVYLQEKEGGVHMIIWFLEIPIIMVVFAVLAMCFMGSALIGWIARIMFGVGLIMMLAAIPVLIISAALQHISTDMVVKCDKIMKFLCINGGILFVVGFGVICAFGIALM